MRFLAMLLMMLSAAGLAGAPVHARALAMSGCAGMAVASGDVRPAAAHANGHDQGHLQGHHNDTPSAAVAGNADEAVASAIGMPAPDGGTADRRADHAKSMACAACLGLPAPGEGLANRIVRAESPTATMSASLAGRDPDAPFRPPRLTA
jgi:hypothetical protein